MAKANKSKRLAEIERNVRLDRGLVSESRLRRELYAVTSRSELFSIVAIGAVAVAVGLWLSMGIAKPNTAEKIVGLVLTTLGLSATSSCIFAFFYGRRAQERMLFAIASESANTTQNLFVERFANVLPEIIFPESRRPTDDYFTFFSNMMDNSNTYLYKGDVAALTSVRIVDMAKTTRALVNNNVRMLLLDPRTDAAFLESARAQLAREAGVHRTGATDPDTIPTLAARAAEMKADVLASAWGLFKIREYLPHLQLGLYATPPVFFSQLVDDGLFLSFYLGGEYPRGYFYRKTSVVYAAYAKDFQLTWEIARGRGDTLNLEASCSPSDLNAWLTNLGLGTLKVGEKIVDEEYLESIWQERIGRFRA